MSFTDQQLFKSSEIELQTIVAMGVRKMRKIADLMTFVFDWFACDR